MKKFIAALTAILCVMGSAAALPSSDSAKKTNSSTAITAFAASTDSIYAGSYKNPYVDTTVYTHKVTLLSGSEYTENGTTYAIYKYEVSHTDQKKAVTDVSEYRIGIKKWDRKTELDVNADNDMTVENPEWKKLTITVEKNGEKVEESLPIADDGKVTIITSGAFSGSYVKSVDLSGVVYIGDNAFKSCSYITEETIPATAGYVGKGVFDSSGLKTLHVKNEMPFIPASFCPSTKLTDIDFAYPQYIREVGDSAFAKTPLAAPFFNEWYGQDVSKYEDFVVNSSAFADCTSIKSVKMPDNLIKLSTKVFSGNTALSEVIFGKNVKYADQECFSGCSSLKDLTLNPTLEALGGGAFSYCTSLVKVEIPDTLSDWTPEDASVGYGFGGSMFQGCTSLTEVRLPSSLTRIPESTFEGCTALTNVSTLNEDVLNVNIVKIKKNAFKGCTSLSLIEYDNAEIIEESAFEGCTNVKSIILKSSKEIGKAAFKNCSAMTTFEAGNCTSVGDNAMEGCKSMTTINLSSLDYGKYVFKDCSGATAINISGKTMEVIPEGLFSGCTLLEKEDFPAARIIETSAFENCTSIKSIKEGSNVIQADDYGNKCFYNCQALDSIISGDISTIGADAFRKSGIIKLELAGMVGGTVVIGNTAFAECPALAEATILSDGVEKFSVGTGLFSGCTKLTKAVYEGPIITASMFKGCESLKTVETNATTINANAFEGCTLLGKLSDRADSSKSIIASNIGESAFKDCSSLTVAPADKNTAYTGKNQYQNCSSLKAFETSILTENMLNGCVSLTDVSLNGITAIPNKVFQNCVNLEELDLSSVDTIGTYAFANSGLKNVTIKNAQSIDSYAFANCNDLVSIDVASVSIGSNAFTNDIFLEKAVICAKTIDKDAFKGDSSLREVELQNSTSYSLTSIGSGAFNNCPVLYEVVVPGSPTMGGSCLGFVNGKVNADFLLVGETGSTVEEYATKNKIAFMDINSYNPTERKKNRNLPGDVDGNAIVSMADAVKLQSWLLGKQTPGIVGENMDVNGDGRVDIFDMVKIRQNIIRNS